MTPLKMNIIGEDESQRWEAFGVVTLDRQPASVP